MAKRKIIITESMAHRLIAEEALSKLDISALATNRDFKDAVAKALKDNNDFEKEFNKKVKKIVADAVKQLFKGLWERNNFWSGIITNN